MVYTTPGDYNITRLSNIPSYMNEITGDVFGISIIFAFFFICFITLKRFGYDTDLCLITSTFLSTIWTVMWLAIDNTFVNNTVLYALIILTMIAFIILILRKKETLI